MAPAWVAAVLAVALLTLYPQASRVPLRKRRTDGDEGTAWTPACGPTLPRPPHQGCFAKAAERIRRMATQRLRAYPVSFCYPTRLAWHYHRRLWNHTKTAFVIDGLHSVPGKGYRITDEETYLWVYAAAHFVRTKKKGGWDCMRHLEIIAAGSLPIVDHAFVLDEFALFMYPKECFRAFASAGHRARPRPAEYQLLREGMWRFFLDHLTCGAVVRYVAAAVDFDPCHLRPVLFLDESLPIHCDYLATSVLIGFREVLGTGVHVWREPTYLYANWTGDPKTLYGNGFGYSMTLPSALLSYGLADAVVRHRLLSGFYHAVIYGNYGRSLPFWEDVVAALPPSRVWAFYGEDRGPLDARERGRSFHDTGRAANATVFVREMTTAAFGCHGGLR